jgi:hypothetical protein
MPAVSGRPLWMQALSRELVALSLFVFRSTKTLATRKALRSRPGLLDPGGPESGLSWKEWPPLV